MTDKITKKTFDSTDSIIYLSLWKSHTNMPHKGLLSFIYKRLLQIKRTKTNIAVAHEQGHEMTLGVERQMANKCVQKCSPHLLSQMWKIKQTHKNNSVLKNFIIKDSLFQKMYICLKFGMQFQGLLRPLDAVQRLMGT
jgi:hypothetical protein